LRPKESLLANTRLFFGVEWETEAEKAESGYKLKVGHITIFSVEGNDAVAEIKPQFFYRISCPLNLSYVIIQNLCSLFRFKKNPVLRSGRYFIASRNRPFENVKRILFYVGKCHRSAQEIFYLVLENAV